MKFYQKAKSTFAVLGIGSNQRTFNGKMLVFFTMFWLDATLNCMYTFREANTFGEYSESVFVTTYATMFAMLYTIMILNWTTVYEIIDIIEEHVERSMFVEIFQ